SWQINGMVGRRAISTDFPYTTLFRSELKRLRVSSIDQVEADKDLMDAIAEEQRLMPHLHLSLQAGDDLILKRMKRRHLRSDAIRDRKSTRLNSSHVKITYADCCLKKK